MTAKRTSWFDKNPKKTLAVFVGLTIIVSTIGLELVLGSVMGFGDPLLYYANLAYGYRLLPNQDVSRFFGSQVKINNLGLRTDENWDDRVENRVLFLGDSVTYGGSYVSNNELFSTLAVKNLEGYQAGNAGINAWGVENIHGLIVNAKFLPASVYVTVVPEGDFYRGITRLTSVPYWGTKPRFAFEELLFHVFYTLNLRRYRHVQSISTDLDQRRVVETAVVKLREMDDLLASRGYTHLLYISPGKQQTLGNSEKDKIVMKYLAQYDLHATYILDRLQPMRLTADDVERIYYDAGVHLTQEGHRVWAEIIGQDLASVIQDQPSMPQRPLNRQ